MGRGGRELCKREKRERELIGFGILDYRKFRTDRKGDKRKKIPVRWHSGKIRKTQIVSLLSVTSADIGNELMCGAILKSSAICPQSKATRGILW